jgi:LicD family
MKLGTVNRAAAMLRTSNGAGCTRETLRCDFWNWGPEAVRPPCCTSHLTELTEFVHELLERHGIPHWLDYGTLLGAAREQGLIAWDGDVDFGFLEVDKPRILALEPEITAHGYVVDTESGEGAIRIRYSAVNEQHLDLFWWRDENRTMTSDEPGTYDWPGRHNRTAFPASYLEDMEPVWLCGKQYPAPSPVDDFLVDHRYGPDYMTPARPVGSVWLCPEIEPEEMSASVKRLLSSLAEKDARLARLKFRSRLRLLRPWRAWCNAGLPLSPPARYVEQALAGVPAPERTEVVEQLAYSVAAFDHAIEEFEQPPPLMTMRRFYRRAARGAQMVRARLTRKPRPSFGQS